jgi:hypothetical protein
MRRATVINISPTVKIPVFENAQVHQRMLTRNSHAMKPIKAATEITVNQRIQTAPNQSASCPLSKTICSVASQTPAGRTR